MNGLVPRLMASLLLALLSSTVSAAELEGHVDWAEPVTLSTNLAAQVMRVNATPGQRVKQGELLLQLEDKVSRAQREQARAEVAHQKLLRAEAQSELQRSEELYARTLLSDHDLDVSRIAAAAAESSYQGAMARLQAAQRALELSGIQAPFDGLITQQLVQAGETVNGQHTAAPLFILVPVDTRRVRLELEAGQLSRFTVGDLLEVEVGKRRYRGQVNAISFYRDKQFAARATVDIRFSPASGDTVMLGEVAKVVLP